MFTSRREARPKAERSSMSVESTAPQGWGNHMVIHSPVSVFFILFFSAVFLKRRGAAHDSMRCCANASEMRIPTFQMHRTCCPLDVAL